MYEAERSSARAVSDSLTSIATGRLRARTPEWTFHSFRGDSLTLRQTTGNWRLLVLTRTGCEPCAKRLTSLSEQLQQLAPLPKPPEVWLITDRFSAGDQLDSLANRYTVRVLRDLGAQWWSELGVTSVPVLVIVDDRGAVHSVSVGHYPGIYDSLGLRLQRQ